MKKNIKIMVFVVLLIIIGICLLHLLDNDNSLLLPVQEKINTTIQKTEKQVRSATAVKIDHIVIITMENKSYGEIVGNNAAPYINSLISQYSLATNYFAVSHPSLPNYIALIGGSTFGIASDCTDCYVSSTNLIDQLEESHKTWKAYMESMPSPCFIGSANSYAQKHNPFIYFDNIRNNQNRCNNIVPYSQLASDFKFKDSTPNFVWISPNLCSDMHDCSVQKGDTWLSEQIPILLNSQAFKEQNLLLIVTWDEREGTEENKVPTILIGKNVKKKFISQASYTHHSLLHTIENLWNISPLTANVSQSSVMTEFFQ